MILTEYNQTLHERTLIAEGEAKGEAKGVDKMAKLTKILLDENRYDALSRATEDVLYRNHLFVEYGL